MELIKTIKEAWGWVGLEPREVIGENSFGNLIIKDSLGCYWRLCPEELECIEVAKNRNELNKHTSTKEFLEDWYMDALVDKAVAHLGALPSDKKYCLVIPSPLGGKYEITNIKTITLHELIKFSGDIANQIRDLSDGAQIKLQITE